MSTGLTVRSWPKAVSIKQCGGNKASVGRKVRKKKEEYQLEVNPGAAQRIKETESLTDTGSTANVRVYLSLPLPLGLVCRGHLELKETSVVTIMEKSLAKWQHTD